jgi:hypothetical protein
MGRGLLGLLSSWVRKHYILSAEREHSENRYSYDFGALFSALIETRNCREV